MLGLHLQRIESHWSICSQGNPMRVFVVDDSAVIRGRLKRMLADEPKVQVIGEAGDAHGATDAILQLKPDVVLLDLHLLEGSGIDVLQSLKHEQPAPAVIILTDYPYPEYRQMCLDAGADFFFIKSTEFDRVVPALNQLIQQAGAAASLGAQKDPGNEAGGHG
jgi:DNA-binding NarL/FixJ family response regulator